MPNINSGLTKSQSKTIELFLHLFADIEAALKKRLSLRADDRTPVSALIDKYQAKNPYWTDSANRLRILANIRNVLTHHRSTAHGYPIAVTPNSITLLKQTKEHLVNPEPVSTRYRKDVKTVSANDSLAAVLILAFENGFSQFPVVDDGRFGGLITENEITRWLGRRVRTNAPEVDLRTVAVETVLEERDPTSRGIAIFHFKSPDAPIEEVMGLFSAEPMLEVILLTQSGNKHTPIEGIITQWDAARYST
jgi:predicted transcriptional regulator